IRALTGNGPDDMGINGSGYSSPSFTIGDAHDGYLYSLGDDFAIGNAATGRDLKFFTNGTLAANERMRVTSAGNVGIGITAPEQPLHVVKNTVGTGPTRDDVVSDGAEYTELSILNGFACRGYERTAKTDRRTEIAKCDNAY
ncbi:MAG TPA: hypothetical protein PK289_05010, partial [Bacteroidia bacterium]|nr:hypothetical protein [Bacteroidia bacterium]